MKQNWWKIVNNEKAGRREEKNEKGKDNEKGTHREIFYEITMRQIRQWKRTRIQNLYVITRWKIWIKRNWETEEKELRRENNNTTKKSKKRIGEVSLEEDKKQTKKQ